MSSEVRTAAVVAILLATASSGAFAADSADSIAIRAQIEALRVEQARIAEMQRQTEAKIRALEASVGVTSPSAQTAPDVAPTAPAPMIADGEPKLNVTGDLRLRYQGDYSDEDARARKSGQVRGRLGATYAVNDRLTLGARLATGDSDDPNSTDVQLSNFDDDFEVSLDQVYARLDFGDVSVYGGKIPQPFTRTDLVWDGDVNPDGVSAMYQHKLGSGATLRANGLFFIVDEDAGGADSTLMGAQLGYDTAELGDFKFGASAAYYDYTLGSIVGADDGDFRTNLRRADGNYLSDFDLGDLIVEGTWSGLGSRWPVRFVGDYVKNFGAETSEDTGYSMDLSIGRVTQPHDWRVTYGYSVAETDAVFAAFSHDNIGIGTNYELHALTLDYVPLPKTLLTAWWYHYKPENAFDAGANAVGDWLDRLRIAFLVSF
ncbi:putative porin [Steroidobacter sp. S1-65]|uniref:Porin n=1 Tax=Steroidobacter gossypii TaxID=2805490 RepID=A0ABS1WWP3_9GAMM|nr:putative porin [Steroidobacter gossypii]MBM0105362.1 putative porin [Steroidobacter gossypii]